MEIIHSKNSTNGSQIDLFESLKGRYQLTSFQMTNNLGNVFTHNNKIYLTVNSIDYEIEIPLGYYTFSQLPNAIQTAIQTATGESISVTGDSNSRKLTFSNDTPFKFNFSTFSNNSASKILGITGNTALATSQISNISCDLKPIKSFFCHIQEDK